MRALVYEAPRVMRLREVEAPAPGRRDVVLRVAYSGICGSELSGFLGQNSLRTPPLVFGHELSGVVEQLGPDVEDVEIGAMVTANPLVSCGRCSYCLLGQHQLCPSRLLLGASLPGSNSEYVVVSARTIERIPEGLALRDGAMAEPAACALHAVQLAAVGPGDSALVVGTGPIGLFLVQVLLAHGLRHVFATDRHPVRRRMAADLGAEVVPSEERPLLTAVRDLTHGSGVSAAFDAAGSQQTRGNCLAASRPGGKVVLIGLHTDQTALPLNALIRNEVAIQGVFAYTPTAFRTALEWLADGRLGLRDGVVEAPLEDGPSWYEQLVDGAPAAKVLLRPSAQVEASGERPVETPTGTHS